MHQSHIMTFLDPSAFVFMGPILHKKYIYKKDILKLPWHKDEYNLD